VAYEPIATKKFLNSTGVGHLWEKIIERYDSKLDSVTNANDSISVSNNREISVNISAEADNRLQLITTGSNKGLYVSPVANQDTYSIVKDAASGDYAAVYHLQVTPNGSGTPQNVGAAINIPKDMVVESGAVVTKQAPGPDDPWPYAGTFIELTLANDSEDKLYIDVAGLIEYVTSGSESGDMVVINIDGQHRVTATITDDTITAAKLAPAIRAQLAAGSTAVQSISEGATNGTIDVDGTEVSVHGLGSAAYLASTAFDAAGSADAVLGTNTDTASMVTVHGVKQYASDAYAAIIGLTNSEIDAAIAAANV